MSLASCVSNVHSPKLLTKFKNTKFKLKKIHIKHCQLRIFISTVLHNICFCLGGCVNMCMYDI